MKQKFTETPQWNSGSDVADFLDAYFRAQGWQIDRTTETEERIQCLGDRHFRKPDKHLYVEYKSGLQTAYTGNVFLETVSVDSQQKPGWVYTCQADYLMYAILPKSKILLFVPRELRERMEDLKARFREVPTGKGQNVGYKTWGLIVPLDYVEQHVAHKVIDCGTGK